MGVGSLPIGVPVLTFSVPEEKQADDMAAPPDPAGLLSGSTG